MTIIKNLSDKEFKDFIEKSNVALIDFYADWCAPCYVIKPVMEELSDELEGKAEFGKIDVDKNKERATEFGIMSIPTLLIFSKGKLVDRLTGAVPKEIIKERLGKFID
ncbi:MAG: thioredoxin [Candidatus Aenigmarchaeota archaeon]|nr:thioredoxin [Candidatus Aenigmarchaeota archaeon]MCK4531802.1 thioredoxin [Candidatus Aenigmarchaeota archaeon]